MRNNKLTLSFVSMKKILTALVLISFFYACNNSDKKATSESEGDLDAARMFLRNALDGKWEAAKQFLVQDSTNVQLIETAENEYAALDKNKKRSYREAEPRFHGSRNIGDTVTIFNYSNSYMNQRDSLKVVKINGRWLIDLKYSLLPSHSNTQMNGPNENSKDTLK